MSHAPGYPRSQVPRLTFSGLFFSDPSTINNNVLRYDINNFRPSFQEMKDEANMNGSWNPQGTASFSFADCVIKTVKTIRTSSTKPNIIPGLPDESAEPLIGQTIHGNTSSVQGKMADLDPQMQTCSEIFGEQIRIGCEDGPHLFGELMPCALQDIWSAIEGNSSLDRYSGMYQTILKITSYNLGSSPFLQDCAELIEESKAFYPGGAMTVSFRLDNFESDSTKDLFRYGNATGYIEPWLPGTPQQFYASRALRPIDRSSNQAAYCHVQKDENNSRSIFMCLLNSFQRETPTKYKDVGKVYLCTLPAGYDPIMVISFNIIQEIPYLDEDWENETGGIVEIPIQGRMWDEIDSNPLCIVSIVNSVHTVLLCEANDGIFVRADTFCQRLNPDETKDVHFYVTEFGKRVSCAEIKIGFDSTGMIGTGESSIGGPEPGTPASAVTINGETPPTTSGVDFGHGFETSVMTDRNGYACVPLIGGDTTEFRKYIDGQVYSLRYSATGSLPPLNANLPASDKVNIRVFDTFEVPEKPSWIVDIYPIFKQYANLYPSMDTIVRLDDFGNVADRRNALRSVFSAPESDPRYMPTVRDLSIKKREMILYWLSHPVMDEDSLEYGMPLYMNIYRKEDLRAALQTVIELEHATIPPYLTALYSIKAGYNQYIADSIREVVEEEMVHFAIACNIMISIGMSPNINKIGFVPKFPGLLPGGLRSGLVLRLRKCSVDQMKVFMSLEAPLEQKLPDKREVQAGRGQLQKNSLTIAFAYDKILEALEVLSEAEGENKIEFPDESNDPDSLKNQIAAPDSVKLFRIENLELARSAIGIIKSEGEGASPSDPSEGNTDPETGLPDLAHFFRFAEIVKGRRLVSDTSGEFSYTGPKIELDEEGIYNMQDDPNIKWLPVGSKARERMEAFAWKYQSLLNGLHRAFNGEPQCFPQTISLMYQLTISAKPLMELPAINPDGTAKNDGTTVGISFQVPFDSRT